MYRGSLVQFKLLLRVVCDGAARWSKNVNTYSYLYLIKSGETAIATVALRQKKMTQRAVRVRKTTLALTLTEC